MAFIIQIHKGLITHCLAEALILQSDHIVFLLIVILRSNHQTMMKYRKWKGNKCICSYLVVPWCDCRTCSAYCNGSLIWVFAFTLEFMLVVQLIIYTSKTYPLMIYWIRIEFNRILNTRSVLQTFRSESGLIYFFDSIVWYVTVFLYLYFPYQSKSDEISNLNI